MGDDLHKALCLSLLANCVFDSFSQIPIGTAYNAPYRLMLEIQRHPTSLIARLGGENGAFFFLSTALGATYDGSVGFVSSPHSKTWLTGITVQTGYLRKPQRFENIKGAELYTVKGGDHYMSSTHAEEINPLIEKFILKYSL